MASGKWGSGMKSHTHTQEYASLQRFLEGSVGLDPRFGVSVGDCFSRIDCSARFLLVHPARVQSTPKNSPGNLGIPATRICWRKPARLPPYPPFFLEVFGVETFLGAVGILLPSIYSNHNFVKDFPAVCFVCLKLSGKPWLGRTLFFAIRVYTAQLYLFGGYQRLANIDG
jgi:hypothetical protein